MEQAQFAIEQATFMRTDNATPQVSGRSQGFAEEWIGAAEEIIIGFGDRPAGIACPLAIFAQPFRDNQVAVVQVADQPNGMLGFHFLIVEQRDYDLFLGDPFKLAQKFPAPWNAVGELATHTLPRQPQPKRTVSDVCDVLRRVKAGALPEGVDPETFQPTAEVSESPALLGGVQILVDGGRLIFERNRPDLDLVQGLWTLLPATTRCRLWPTSFAFGNGLDFDVVVVPRFLAEAFENCTTEDQAINYPEGYYELNLQIAAESGDQEQLDQLLNRRSGRDTFKLGLMLLVLMMVLTLLPRVLNLVGPAAVPEREAEIEHKVSACAAIVSANNPMTSAGILLYAKTRWGKQN